MIIFATDISSRFSYISAFIMKELGFASFSTTANRETFLAYDGPRINYSHEPITENACWIKPHTILFEKNIQPQLIHCFSTNSSTAFFATTGDLPFDIFAASFYLLSRYEEYLPHTKDIYGRYAHQHSLAFKNDFLTIPLINIWIKQFRDIICSKFPGAAIYPPAFSFTPTYDIDEAFAYRHKSRKRIIGAGIRDLVNGDFKQWALRKQVLAGKLPDPYDSFDWMDALHHKYGLHPLYFILLAEKTGKYDKNIHPDKKAMQNLVKRLAGLYTLGIHPSWQSGDDPALIKNEIHNLEGLSAGKISRSRQHFIRFSLPTTFRYLIDAGIKEDFSMGYGSINGFRASVASSFFWYDLEMEMATDLLLHPFCFMEANAFFEQGQTPEEALNEMRHYYRQVKNVNGRFIILWHNTFLGAAERFAGWRECYATFIQEICS